MDNAGPSDTVHDSFFAKIIKTGQLNREQTNVNFANLIFAGVDTTSNVLLWVMYHLARNPHVQEKMRREAVQVLDGRDVSLKDYKALQYSRQVLQETYRLTPVFGTARYLHEPFEVAGATIPPGTMIDCTLSHTSLTGVWERPLEFIPERWEDATKREAMGSSGGSCP